LKGGGTSEKYQCCRNHAGTGNGEVDGKGHYRNTENMIRKLRYKLIDEIELLEMGNH